MSNGAVTPNGAKPFRIAHLSDLHCGEQYFEPTLLDRAIAEINVKLFYRRDLERLAQRYRLKLAS